MIIEFWKTNENPITCYNSRKRVSDEEIEVSNHPKISRMHKNKTPVTVIHPDGKAEQMESAKAASEVVGITINAMYAILNGHSQNKTKFQFFKSSTNN